MTPVYPEDRPLGARPSEQTAEPPPSPLSAEAVLRIWEGGAEESPTRRALGLLEAATFRDGTDLADLPLGERDRRLLTLRSRTLGPELSCQGVCPACDERLEISISTEELLEGALPEGSGSMGETEIETEGTFHYEELELRFRLPTSADLLAAEACPSDAEAQRLLVARCIQKAKRGGAEIPPEELSEDELAALGDHLSALDPMAETLFELACQACGHRWSQPLEIGEVFYEEIRVLAQRLLQEVSWLARGYGWSEAEILRLTPARRRAYLEMLWA